VSETMKDGALSWELVGDRVHAWITVQGAQVAPVVFDLGTSTVQPYSLAPWAPGSIQDVPPLLDALRGDFLCLPFGAQSDGPQHGQTASAPWTLTDQSDGAITLHLDASDIGAAVDKTVGTRPGQTALYQEFRITGLDGEFNYGTHPILDFSGQTPGGARISTSPMRWASTNDGPFADRDIGERQVLAESAVFSRLDAIPAADGTVFDVSSYPTAPGHEDLVMLVNDPAAGQVGWAAASCAGYVWFALKDVAAFPATLLWISNGGRPQAPWQSVHTGRMGIEDICSYFADGLEASRENRLDHLGIATTRLFEARTPVTLRTVQAVAATPSGFGRVADIVMGSPGFVTIVDDFGTAVECVVDWDFVLDTTP
jgi:hypothetical protein